MLIFKNLILFSVLTIPLNLMAQVMLMKANSFSTLSILPLPGSIESFRQIEDLFIISPQIKFKEVCGKIVIGEPLDSINLNQIGRVIDFNSCDFAYKVTDENRFTPAMCSAQISCANAMYRSGISVNLESINETEKIAEEVIAFDMKEKINEMDSVNRLRKFAEIKYPSLDLSKYCKEGVFESPSLTEEAGPDKCKMSIVNNAFRMAEGKCKVGTVNCFPFAEDIKIEPDANLLESVFKERTENRLNESMKNEDLILGALSAIFSDKKLNTNKKVQTAYDYLYKNQLILDPILSQFINGYSTKMLNVSFDVVLRNLIASSENDSVLEIRQKIENLRFQETQKTLLKKCKTVPTVAQLCKTGKELTSGAEVQASREQIIETTKTRKNSNWNIMANEKKLVQDANRCTTFGLGRPFVLSYQRAKGATISFSTFGTDDVTEYESLDEIIKIAGSKKTRKQKKQYIMNKNGNITPDAPISFDSKKSEKTNDRADSLLLTYNSGTIPPKNRVEMSSVIAPSTTSSVTPAITDHIATTTTAPEAKSTVNTIQPSSSTTPFSVLNANEISNSSNALPKVLTSNVQSASYISSTETNNALNDQITALNKKISTSQDRLSKNSSAKVDKFENDSKNDLENKLADSDNSEKINAMKKEVAELKASRDIEQIATTRKKESEVVSPKNTEDQALATSTSSSVSTAPNSIDKNNYTGKATASSSSSHSSESSGAGEMRSSAPVASSPALSANAHIGSSNTLVLTKTDGAEVISNKIIQQQSGESFFIEEDGKFMEVVPLMNGSKFVLDTDGKPRFEKIIKCEGTDKVCIEAKLHARSRVASKKAPASNITSIADLKKSQEEQLKYDRVEYLKLLNLTKNYFDKK
ncbi:MAG: hypothetical protein H7281_01600 [Bacteriovorax sp.]|nr:hypothetical protein [Bacteriovorax sp.]